MKNFSVKNRLLWLAIAGAITFSYNTALAVTYEGVSWMTFQQPAGTTVDFVPLISGNDVVVKFKTMSSGADNTLIDAGKVQLRIATDGKGFPTTAILAKDWVNISGNVQPVEGAGTFNVNLDGLFDLNILDSEDDFTNDPTPDDDDSPERLQNVTCSNTTVGFRVYYFAGEGPDTVKTHTSPGFPLGISCSSCGTSTDLIIGIEGAEGQGTPAPGSSGPWSFKVTTTNCTPDTLTGVKVQGGSNGWAPIPSPVKDNVDVTTDGGAAQTSFGVKQNKKNQVITWVGDMPTQSSVSLDVQVDGAIKPNHPCDPEEGSVLFISGPWSAAYTKPDLSTAKTDYTDRVSLTVTCPSP